jgi:hypothetical protein
MVSLAFRARPLYTIVGWREAGATKYPEAVLVPAGFAGPVVGPLPDTGAHSGHRIGDVLQVTPGQRRGGSEPL